MHLVGVARADHGQLETRNGLYQRGMKGLANKAKTDESNTNGGFAHSHEKDRSDDRRITANRRGLMGVNQRRVAIERASTSR